MVDYDVFFGERKKQKYGMLSNMAWILREIRKHDWKLLLCLLFMIPLSVGGSVIGTYLPSVAVERLQAGDPFAKLLGAVLALIAAMTACKLLECVCSEYGHITGSIMQRMNKKILLKQFAMDFDLLEQPELQRKMNNAVTAGKNSYSIEGFYFSVSACISGAVGAVAYGIIVGGINPWLLVVAAVNMIGSTWFLQIARKKHAAYADRLRMYAKETMYINRSSMDTAAGKDIRIFHMLDWMMSKYDKALSEMDEIYTHVHNWYFLGSAATEVMGFCLDLFAYLYLIVLLVNGQVSVAEFVLLLGSVRGFARSLDQVLKTYTQIPPVSVSVSFLREFFETEESEGWNGKVTEEMLNELKKKPLSIELRDVGYTYPGAEKPVLSHLNLTIAPGEKLALIGLNGAGKTTLVKLICGLYRPTEGEILIAGIPQGDFAREDYYELISVLFQDAMLLPVTVDENLTGGLSGPESLTSGNKLCEVLKFSGFQEKYDRLAKGGQTPLVKEVNEGAAEFSGGEKQKMLFARALYKDASILILDEPTAALDPIAENQLYMSFSEAAAGRTAIYISHRLSSTRFCDRIVLLSEGTIAEEGTHETLMAAGGIYAGLYQVQSRYYQSREEQKKQAELFGDTYDRSVPEKLEGVF